MRASRLILLWALVAPLEGIASASPNVPLDDPVYAELARLHALGRLPFYENGLRPLTEAAIQDLLASAGAPSEPTLLAPRDGRLWIRPFNRVIVRSEQFFEDAHAYELPNRPLPVGSGMAGRISLACEHQEGRPCGNGAGLMLELDSSAGYGRWVSGFMRLRAVAGDGPYSLDGALDRGYVNAELGPLAIEIGRDVLALGPGVHTQLLWGTNAAPLDAVRLSTSRLLQIPRVPIRVNALVFAGRLRDPQRFHDTILTGGRLAFTLLDQVQIGVQQILELCGDGALCFNVGDFIVEQFNRVDCCTGPDRSNRRISFDLTYTFPWLRGTRVYYELAFEDMRERVLDAFIFDGDHLFGVELPAVTRRGHHGLLLEVQHNGVRSQSHTLYTSGMTNGGFAVGSPLGPDSWSVYAEARLDVEPFTISPWLELARISSDTYQLVEHGPIFRTSSGIAELRYRIGARARVAPSPSLRLECRALFEHVDSFAFVAGAARDNLGIEMTMTWFPYVR